MKIFDLISSSTILENTPPVLPDSLTHFPLNGDQKSRLKKFPKSINFEIIIRRLITF